MKLSAKEIKTCHVAYLHNDGHLVIWHEKRDRDAGKVEWVTIHENVGVDVRLPENQRLIIRRAVLPFLIPAVRIVVHPATVKSGSDKTREMGLTVETIELRSKTGEPWFISNFPGIISSDLYCYNSEDTFDKIKEKQYWGDLKIKEIHKATA